MNRIKFVSLLESLEARRLFCLDALAANHQPGDEVQAALHAALMAGDESATLLAKPGEPANAVSSTLAAPITPFYPSTFKVKINFAPKGTTPPAGYSRDEGDKYGARSNGLTYGWKSSISSKMVKRNNSASMDVRYDTFAPFNKNNYWEIAVPRGTYYVRYSVGDTSKTGTVFKIDVEKTFSLLERTSGKSTFIERGITVNVTDGKLGITTPSSETMKLNWVEITGQTAPPPNPLPLKWSKSGIKTPIGKNETRGLQVGNKVFILGGFTEGFHKTLNRMDIFNLDTQKWSRGANLPGAQSHAGIATDGKYIYYVSGQYGTRFGGGTAVGTKESWRYDIAKNKWEKFVAFPAVRFAPGLVHLDGKLYAFGGAGSDRIQSTTDHYVLDLKNTKAGWKKLAPMLLPADHFGVTALNGKIYAVGGEHDHSRGYAQHDFLIMYDPKTNKWKRLADLPTHSSHFESSLIIRDGKIWVFGGVTDGLAKLTQVRVYDPATDSWTMYTPLPRGSDSAVIGVKGDKLWYFGGQTLDAGGIKDVYTTTLPAVQKTTKLVSATSMQTLFNSQNAIEREELSVL